MNGIKTPSYIRIGFLLFGSIFALHTFVSCSLLPLPKAEDIKNRHEPLFEPSDVFSPEESPELNKAMESMGNMDRESHGSLSYMEEEIRKLNVKVKSLEAKIAVLQEKTSMDRIASEQPMIEAESSFALGQEAPIRSYQSAPDRSAPKRNDRAETPALKTLSFEAPPAAEGYNAELALPPRASYPMEENQESFSENEFQEAMRFYERGGYVEAKDRFFRFYKKYPKHVLASHALYWAGKASEQTKAWRDAIRYWTLLETDYSFRSIYMPEVWEGLSRAFMILGNEKKARKYKELLQGIFPQSPKTASYTPAGLSRKK